MFTSLRLQNVKSWADTGEVRLGKLTGLFGTNSSGKTSLLQSLLMLKQTAESQDRSRVLHLGGDQSYVDLGTFSDLVHGHTLPQTLDLNIAWRPPSPVEVRNPLLPKNNLLQKADRLTFDARIRATGNETYVERFAYGTGRFVFGMQREQPKNRRVEYRLLHDEYDARRTAGRRWQLPEPVKCYAFPDEATAYYQNVGFLSDLVLAFERQFQRTYYLGPLREYPGRNYAWDGERPQDVGRRGEKAVAALLASRASGETLSPGYKRKRRTIVEHVAWWLKEMGIVHDFEVEQIAEGHKLYEVRVRVTEHAPWVLITDVGFGVSQVLPVLVLCFYAPEGSTIVLEQPEIHLHPRVQAALADVLLDAIDKRGLQIVLESHSEHLLRRLQTRIAEEKINADDVALYFAEMTEQGSSLRPLDLDLFGNIRNWPADFFGDEMGEIAAQMDAQMRRMGIVEEVEA